LLLLLTIAKIKIQPALIAIIHPHPALDWGSCHDFGVGKEDPTAGSAGAGRVAGVPLGLAALQAELRIDEVDRTLQGAARAADPG
jgi:hypothetical protein